MARTLPLRNVPATAAGFADRTEARATRRNGSPARCARSSCHQIGRACGFTLLELLVVMVIIGLLAGYVAPKFFGQVDKSAVKTAQAQIVAFDKALGAYRLDTGRFPSSEQGLEALVTRPANEVKWDGPYLDKRVPADPWGNAYLYRFPGEHRDYDLLSLGKDGSPGGEGTNADVTNW